MFTPPGGASSLTLTVTMSGPETNPRASAIVLRATGNDPPVPLASGVSTPLTIDPSVTGILLVLSNGSTRFAGCDTDPAPPFFSCFGFPVDDTVSFAVNATSP